jgi:hypothetical protein
MKVVKNVKPEAMSENVKYYFKRDGTELCPHTKTKISSPFCLYLCKHCIKKNYVYGWIICEKLNKDAWRKKSEELIIKLQRERLISDLSGNILWDRIEKLKPFCIKLIDFTEKCKKENNSFKLLNQTFNKMKKENINIEIPKGYVPELKDGKVTLVYKGDSLDKMPKSWEELRTVTGEYICGDDNISEARSYDCKKMYKDVIPKGLGKPMLALIQLLQLRNRTWEVTDTKPPDSNGSYNIYFNKSDGRVEGGRSNIAHSVMSFDSEKVRDRFMEYHRDLLWEARELL